jgi:O-antigen/teichoic acid export membrane protein
LTDNTQIKGKNTTLLIRVLGTSLSYILNIFLARWLGVVEYGLYAYALSLVSVLCILAILGLDGAVLRLIASDIAKSLYGQLRGTIYKNFKIVLISSGIIILIGLIVMFIIQNRLANPLSSVILMSFLLIPLYAVSNISRQALRSFKLILKAQIPDEIFRPLGIIFLAYLMLKFYSFNAFNAIIVTAVVLFIVESQKMAFLMKKISQLPVQNVGEYSVRELLRISLPMLLASGMYIVMSQTDILMVGYFLGTTKAGIYAAAAKISLLVSFSLYAANFVAAPFFAELHAQENSGKLQMIVDKTTSWMIATTIPLLLICIFFASHVLGLFGKEFIGAKNVLIILSLGQAVNALAGSVGHLLNMTGNQDEVARVLTGVAFLNIVLNAIALSFLDIEGAAIATAFSTAVWNLFLVKSAHKKLGVITFKPFKVFC